MRNRIATIALIVASLTFAGYATEPAHSCDKSKKTECCKNESCAKDGSECCKSGTSCDHSKCKSQSCCKNGCNHEAKKN